MAAVLTPDAYYPPAEAARLREANRIVRQVQASLEHALSHPDEPPLHMPNCRCVRIEYAVTKEEACRPPEPRGFNSSCTRTRNQANVDLNVNRGVK